jgi:hypothetical protein
MDPLYIIIGLTVFAVVGTIVVGRSMTRKELEEAQQIIAQQRGCNLL